MNQFLQKTLDSSLRECESHRQKIQRVQDLLRPLFPLETADFDRLSDEEVEHLDQLIYRFIKMQDSLGKRLLPSLYSLLEENTETLAFLDILHRLEKLRVLTSVEDWQFFRNLRNNLSHDYPESIKQTVTTLNLLMEKMAVFVQIFATAKTYWNSRNEPYKEK